MKCKFKLLKNKKLYCETHEQALMYVYLIDGEYKIICQVGEDEASLGEHYDINP